MNRPNITPGKREVSFSHGHAYIKRDGDIFAVVTLGRDSHGIHSEGIHLAVADEARAIAAVPQTHKALERALGTLERMADQLESYDVGTVEAIRSALSAAGYQF